LVALGQTMNGVPRYFGDVAGGTVKIFGHEELGGEGVRFRLPTARLVAREHVIVRAEIEKAHLAVCFEVPELIGNRPAPLRGGEAIRDVNDRPLAKTKEVRSGAFGRCTADERAAHEGQDLDLQLRGMLVADRLADATRSGDAERADGGAARRRSSGRV